ncbi:hypothetical protein BJ944DRAFT_157543 [Cunninghamella echinulata]|nr:hypothetical protein BJ944DRAFT_157543 [Cunninghamella echinulata]
MTQTYTELQSHIDQLWKIIEQQEKQIQELKKDNQKVCSERDELQAKLRSITSKGVIAESAASQIEKSVEVNPVDNDNNSSAISKQNGIDQVNPILPTRSPYRSSNTNDTDLNTSKDINNNSSTKLPAIGTSTLDTSAASLSISQGPVSPIIIEHDAKFKSSTLPSQTRDSRIVNRKQHNSMVFPSSIIIPTNNKKEDAYSTSHSLDHSSLRRSESNAIQEHSADLLTQQSSNELNSISDVTVKVVGSVLKSNEKGKDVVAFILSVGKHQNNRYEELWRVEKLYSDFLDLDLKLKTQMNRSGVYKMTRLPEKQLFATRSPNKLDQRRIALEKYLQNAITLPMDDIGNLCEFLSTDVVEQPSYTNEGKKEGYLIKRGKNFGGWKTRYFVIKKKRLDYYEVKDGSKLGSILLDGAQIGRQNPTDSMDEHENVYRHAFLIVEPKKTTLGNFTKHILCASNDSERDEWITALVEVIHHKIEKDSTQTSRKKSSDKRKPSKGEIRTVAATPISQLRINPIHAIDMEKLTSVPAVSNNNNNTKDDHSTTTGSNLAESLPLEMYDITNASNTSWLDSPIPTSQLDRRESDDSVTNEQQQQQQIDKKNKSKAANRMTLLGKKIFGNQQRPSTNQAEGNLVNNSMSNGRPSSPIPNYSNTSYHPLAVVTQEQQQQQQQRTGTQKSLRHILSRSPQNDNLDHIPTPTNHPSMPKQVFGVSLEEAVRVSRISENYHLPAIVFRCIEYLDAKNAVLEEGLYRLSGSNVVLQNLKKKFNQDGDIPLLNNKEEYDVHAIAGLLKMWLRELPISVLTRELRPEFIKVIDRKDRINELGRLVSLLPLENYTLLRILIAHLISVVKHSDTNRMTVRNISIVFSPTLGLPGTIFNLFLSEFEYIFWTTDDGNATPRKMSQTNDSINLDEKEESSQQARKFTVNDEHGRSNRNSIIYMHGAPTAIVNLEKLTDGKGMSCN